MNKVEPLGNQNRYNPFCDVQCDSPRYVEKFVFVTHLPCTACAKRLINIGNVKKVFFEEDYRNREAISLFKTTGIEIFQIEGKEVIKVEE